MDNLTLSVREFSFTPGPRHKDEGPYCGEEFRENFLEGKYKLALDNHAKLIVNLDGTIGYGTSWLEEVFGGLARKYGNEKVLNTLEFISEEEPYLIKDIKGYIKHA